MQTQHPERIGQNQKLRRGGNTAHVNAADLTDSTLISGQSCAWNIIYYLNLIRL